MESGGGDEIDPSRDTDRLDELFSELVATRLAHERAPTPEDKARLDEKLTELRGRVASLPMAGVSGLDDRELQHRIEGLRSRIDSIYRRRMNPSFCSIPSEAGGGIDPITWFEITAQVDRDTGLAALEHELRLLTEEMERRRPRR